MTSTKNPKRRRLTWSPPDGQQAGHPGPSRTGLRHHGALGYGGCRRTVSAHHKDVVKLDQLGTRWGDLQESKGHRQDLFIAAGEAELLRGSFQLFSTWRWQVRERTCGSARDRRKLATMPARAVVPSSTEDLLLFGTDSSRFDGGLSMAMNTGSGHGQLGHQRHSSGTSSSSSSSSSLVVTPLTQRGYDIDVRERFLTDRPIPHRRSSGHRGHGLPHHRASGQCGLPLTCQVRINKE